MPHDKDTVLVLPGDIDVGKHVANYVNRLAPRFKAIILVLGNHEMYGENLDKIYDKVRGLITEDNVHLLQNQKVQIEDVEFLGTTLWTDMNNHDPFDVWNAPNKMNDFKKIRYDPNYRRLSSAVWLYENNEARRFLKRNINGGKVQVVVTHHAPDYMCSTGCKYHGQASNAYYYNTNMQNLICDAGTWIYGHTHNSFDRYLGDTRVLTNPMGYHNIDMCDLDQEGYLEV